MKKDRLFVVYDSILVVVALYISLALRFDFKVPEEYFQFFLYSTIPVILITVFFNWIFKLYKNIWKYASTDELLSITYSVSLANLTVIVYSYLITYKLLKSSYYRFPLTVLLIFWSLSIALLGGVRFLSRIMSRQEKTKDSKCQLINLLVIGAGDAGALLMKEINKHGELKYNLVGFIDDDYDKKGRHIGGIKVLGGREDIIRVCKKYAIEEIIVAMPSTDFATKTEILNICKKTKCKLKTIPGIYEIIEDKVSIKQIRDVNIEDLLGRDEVKLSNENIKDYIEDRTVLVTGGGGSIGSELCRQIIKFKPKELIILDIYENNAYDLQMELIREYPNLDIRVVIASIRELERLRNIFKEHRPNVVFHAAAHKHVPLMENNPGEAIKNNIVGTYNVAKCSSEFNVKKFVMISTDKAVNPTNIMGATKRFCEMIIQAFDAVSSTEYVAVRFGNVLGSNGSVIPLFKKQIAKGGPVTVTHPEINRFFMTIPEASQLVIQAGAMAKGGEIFVLDMGKPVKIAELAKDLIELSGLKPNVDVKIEYTGLRPGEKLYEELLMDEKALESTEHKKIFIEQPREFDIKEIESNIEELLQTVKSGNPENIFSKMEEKVPTYRRKKN
ncbi:polysaccharide biosynthesis protein [Hathewaya histolytica]|uniref:polysaccharide biosynthesis protein n=1 Tax=Hathewaya histolytica TaxID=1498 RepID=UPI003B67008D